ncbi:replication protein A 70 kDa DNA-binding subunit B-like, partial [Capsicum annuum]|uniref:replication protein A 70 kDa DNA-binding subunit B-like n=1 Tax=Capsicum annuum TaxID=4072 RepID=UPI001FB141D0
MDQKLLVDAITTEIADWTCKVQVVEKFRPRESSDSSVHFQTIIVQDEKEQQVSIVLYGDDFPKYEKLFALFETYLVFCAKVRDARGYSIQADTYEWVVDRCTIVEAINTNDGLEAPLSFLTIEYQRPGVEFHLLVVVANCSAIQYTANQSKHFREAIVMDQSKKPFLCTLWGDLADNKGATLLHHLHEHPIILAKRIGVTEFHGGMFITSSSAALSFASVKHNEQMLQSYTLRSSSSSSSSLNLAPIEDQILSISTIPELLSTLQTFPVEARLSLPDHPQSFYLLACSHCNHFVRPKTIKVVHCFN